MTDLFGQEFKKLEVLAEPEWFGEDGEYLAVSAEYTERQALKLLEECYTDIFKGKDNK